MDNEMTVSEENAELLLQEDNVRLAKENEELSKELSLLRADLQRRNEQQQGGAILEEMIGSRSDPLFDSAFQRAQSEELAAFPIEKRYELAYLLCLGQQVREGGARDARTSAHAGGGYPPPFSPSGGGGQVPLSAVKTPTSFEMAKENAKKYFRR